MIENIENAIYSYKEVRNIFCAFGFFSFLLFVLLYLNITEYILVQLSLLTTIFFTIAILIEIKRIKVK